MQKFNKIEGYNPDFIDWVSPKYYERFISIFKEVVGSENESKFLILMNAPLFCNSETKDKISFFLAKHLEEVAELSSTTLAEFRESNLDFTDKFNFVNTIKKSLLSNVNTSIFKRFKSPEIKTHKKTIIDNSIRITNGYKNVKTSNSSEFKLFQELLNLFDKVSLDEKQIEALITLKGKAKKSNNRSYIWGAVIIVLFIARMLLRMNR